MNHHSNPANSFDQEMTTTDVNHKAIGLKKWRPRLAWGIGIGLTIGLAGVVVGGATLHLLQVQTNDCAASYGKDAEPSLRLYCAQELATKQSADDVRDAIRMVDQIPADHPLRLEADRRLDLWSRDLLRLAENLYQEGQLDAAIAAVRTIPTQAPVYTQVNAKVRHWRTTWEKAEALYEKSQAAIDERQWWKGLNTARQLLTLGNRHWETTKYPELMEQLDVARGSQESPAIRRKPVAGKEVAAQWQLKQHQQAATILAKAQTLAKAGDAKGLQTAIAEASKIVADNPQAKTANRLIQTWERQLATLEDRPYLQRATTLAKDDNVRSLESAIQEARKIGRDRPLYKQAQTQVQQWSTRSQQLQKEAQQPSALPVAAPVARPAVVPVAVPAVVPAVVPAPAIPSLPPDPVPGPVPGLSDRQPIDRLPNEFELP
jgi:hypothetical protein